MEFGWIIAIVVLAAVLIAVIGFRCIPKSKLPACLGGCKEQFICPKVFIEECKKRGITPRNSSQSYLDRFNSLDDAVNDCVKLKGNN